MRALLALLIVVPVLAGCASLPGQGLEVAAPSWAPGHSWTTTWESTMDVDAEHDKTQEWNEAEEPTRHEVLRNETLWDEPGWIVHRDGGSGPFQGADLQFVRTPDLASRPLYNAVTWVCEDDVCGTRLNAGLAPSGDAVGPFVDFPLTDGKTWRFEDGQGVHDAEVRGVRPIETEAGDFEAVMIRLTLTGFDAQEEAAEMEEDGATVHRYDVDMEQTLDLYYVPEVEWFALQESRMSVAFDVDVEWGEEDRWTDRGTVEATHREELVGYSLLEQEPATDEEIVVLLEDTRVVGVGAPSGSPYATPVASNVTVDVTVPESVNVADGATHILEVRAEGESGTYTHEWEVYEPDAFYDHSYGDETATGADLEVRFEEIGDHAIEVRTYDNESRFVDVQRFIVDAYYEVALDGSCEPGVHLAGIGDCDIIEFPFPDTWEARTAVKAVADPGVLDDGRLVILDAAGREVASKELRDGAAAIDRDDHGTPGTWSAYVEPSTGTGGTVHYEVRVESDGQTPYWF